MIFNINSELDHTISYSVHSPSSVRLYIPAYRHMIYFSPVKRITIPASLHLDLPDLLWEGSQYDTCHVWTEPSSTIAWFGSTPALLYRGDMHVPQRGCFYKVGVVSLWDGGQRAYHTTKLTSSNENFEK